MQLVITAALVRELKLMLHKNQKIIFGSGGVGVLSFCSWPLVHQFQSKKWRTFGLIFLITCLAVTSILKQTSCIFMPGHFN